MKMRITQQLLFIFISMISSFIIGCSTPVGPADAYKGETSEQIFARGEKALKHHSYQEAIKRFEALDVQYPFGQNTDTAQLHLIYAYYMTNEYASAEAAAARFILAHPTNPHVDYAYYMRGLSSFYQNLGIFERLFTVDLATRDLTQIKKTYQIFSDLVLQFPSSTYGSSSHQYLVYLRNLLANHELEVAQYYFSRKAYIAAANRASLVVRHYQGAPIVPDALVLMVKSYRALQLTEKAKNTQKVLEYNYPDSIYLKQLNKFKE